MGSTRPARAGPPMRDAHRESPATRAKPPPPSPSRGAPTATASASTGAASASSSSASTWASADAEDSARASHGQLGGGGGPSSAGAKETLAGDPILDPIPRPSSWVEVDRKYRLAEGSYADISARLMVAISELGYSERSFYRLQGGGFALACRLEQITDDGGPVEGARRWVTGYESMQNFSIDEYLKRLFTAQSGRYRVIVFVVKAGPLPFVETTAQDAERIRALVSSGSTVLPESVAKSPTPEGLHTYALTYEFRKKAAPDKPEFVSPGLTALQQLARSGFFAVFAALSP